MERNNNEKPKQTSKKEEYAVILDYLSLGYVKSDMSKFRGKPIAQSIGTENFTLLELSPKEGVNLEIHDKVYIGKGKREKINRILGKLDFENLTATSRIEIDYAIRDIIEYNEEKYVDFFNTVGPLSTRLHKLELIPGIGKKHMWAIIEERKKKPFESFEDIKERVPALSDPVAMLVKRIKQELDNTSAKKGKKKYHIFTSIPKKHNDNKKPRRN
jgi:putative nucleotide binding protein